MEPKWQPLMQRMKDVQERFTSAGAKQQGLPFSEIVNRLAEFMFQQHRGRIATAFGNEVGAELEDATDWRFDPIALYAKYPDELSQIQLMVEHELLDNEEELLGRKDESIFAYNTLVFGIAIKLARGEELSEGLRSFAVDHMIAPNPPKRKQGRGRPKKSSAENWEKVLAIQFAVAHGLTRTRNDATAEKVTACDAVENAAKLMKTRYGLDGYETGYGYDNLRDLWYKLR